MMLFSNEERKMKTMIGVLICVIFSSFTFSQNDVITDFNSLMKQVEKIQHVKKSKKKSYFLRKENFYVKQYLCFHPEELNAFYNKEPKFLPLWWFDEDQGINRTNISDQFICELLRARINSFDNKFKNNLDRKHASLDFILTYGIGTKHTLDLLTFAENQYPKPELKTVFKRYPEFIDVFNSYKHSIKNNVGLFEEISQLKEKDIQGWKAVTFSYAHEKYKEFYLENKKGVIASENRSETPMARFIQDFMDTFNSKNTVKAPKKINPEKLVSLFNILKKRGGQCDFRSERLIKKITFYQTRAPQMSISTSNIKITKTNCAFLGDQTLIFDSNGKFRYIFSLFYGKVPMSLQGQGRYNINSYLKNWLFSFGKVIYKNDKPVDFVATQILADDDIFKQIDSSVRSNLKINLLDMVEDEEQNDTFEGPFNYCFYDLQKLGFPKMDKGLSYFRFSDYFPNHPDTEEKVEERFLRDK